MLECGKGTRSKNKLNKPGSRKTKKWRKLWNAVGKEQRFKRVKVVVMIGDNQGREIATGVVKGKSDAMTSEQTVEDVDMDDTETVVAPSATPAELLPEMLPGVAEVMNSKIGASWYQRYRSGGFTDDMILRRCGAEVLEAFQACAATELAQKAGVHMDAELVDVVNDGKTELCGPAGEGSGEARGEGGREPAKDGHAANYGGQGGAAVLGVDEPEASLAAAEGAAGYIPTQCRANSTRSMPTRWRAVLRAWDDLAIGAGLPGSGRDSVGVAAVESMSCDVASGGMAAIDAGPGAEIGVPLLRAMLWQGIFSFARCLNIGSRCYMW